MEKNPVITRTKEWIAQMVIGLNLCPFAKKVFEGDKIRYVVSAARHEKQLLAELSSELSSLTAKNISEVETTLFIHPKVLLNFLDYNDFLPTANRLVKDLRLEDVIQIASFHPEYQFAGSEKDAVENYTNRSPYPMLHLLREESISRLSWDPKELLEIPKRNIETLKNLGKEKVLEKLNASRS